MRRSSASPRSTSARSSTQALLDLGAVEPVELALQAEQLERRSASGRGRRPAGRRRCGAARRCGCVAMSKPATDGLPAGRREQRAEHLHGGGLAGAVGAEQAVDLAPVDGEVEAVDRGDLPEGAGEAAGGDGGVVADSSARGDSAGAGLVRVLVMVCMGSNLRITAARS